MPTLKDSLPATNEMQQPCEQLHENLTNKLQQEKNSAISECLIEAYSVQDVYAKTLDSVTLKAFSVTLNDFDAAVIKSAFAEHLKISHKVPAPADIRELCAGIARDRRESQRMKEIEARQKASATVVTAPRPQLIAKSWACKPWGSMTEADRIELEQWLAPDNWTGEQDKLITYKKYLLNWCDVPATFLGLDHA